MYTYIIIIYTGVSHISNLQSERPWVCHGKVHIAHIENPGILFWLLFTTFDISPLLLISQFLYIYVYLLRTSLYVLLTSRYFVWLSDLDIELRNEACKSGFIPRLGCYL